jgi:oxaloacetate decarboxylase gamma subunit
MQESILEQGVDLMLFGMGTVVAFLAVLVVSTNLMAWVIRRFFPEPEAAQIDEREISEPDTPSGLNARTLAIIKAALNLHRANRG